MQRPKWRWIAQAVAVATIESIVATASGAQPLRSIAGTVVDSTGKPIGLAALALRPGRATATSDSAGRFRFLLANGESELEVRKIGFVAFRIDLRVTADSMLERMHIVLARSATVVATILVPGERRSDQGQAVTRASVRNAPPIGEADIMRSLPFLPGVAAPNDFVPRINLAGAAGDETLVTLDGHPLQAPSHLSGLVGAFNVAALERAEVQMHAVSSLRPTRLGGVVDLQTREPSPRSSSEIVATLLAASGTWSRPSADDRTDVLLSGRYTYLSSIARRVYGSDVIAQYPWPYYGDGLVRLRHRFGSGWRVDAIGFGSHDWTDERGQPGNRGLSTGEALVGVRLQRLLPAGMLSFRISHDRSLATQRAAASPGDLGIQIDQQWRSVAARLDREVNETLALAFAFDIDERQHDLRWGTALGDGVPAGLPRRFDGRQTQMLGAFASEARFASGRGTVTTVGVRVAGGDVALAAAPRVAVSRKLPRGLRFSSAIERRLQYDTEAGDPTDGHLPAPRFLLDRPRAVDAISTTLEGAITGSPGDGVTMSITAFGRSFSDRTVAAARPADSTIVGVMQWDRIRARSSGLAIGLTRQSDKGVSAQLSYTYSLVVERDSTGDHPTDWDAPSNFAGLVTVPLGRAWTFTTTFQLRSGRSVTPVLAQLLVPTPSEPGGYTTRFLYGDRNSARLAPYRRADVAFRRSVRVGGMSGVLSLQIVNVLRAENPYEYDWNQYLAQREFGGQASAQRHGLPMVPSLGLELRW